MKTKPSLILCTDCHECLLFSLSLSLASFMLFRLWVHDLLRIAFDSIPGKNIFIFATFFVIWKTKLYSWITNHRSNLLHERFSVEYGKTKPKDITLTNHNRCKQRHEPIRTRSKCMKLASSAGKHVRAGHDCFWFSFRLADKVAWVFLTNHRP